MNTIQELASRTEGLATLVSDLASQVHLLTQQQADAAAASSVVIPQPAVAREPKMLLPHRFSGDRRKFDTFRESCRLYFRVKPLASEAHMVGVVVSLLQGDPQEWALKLPPTAPEWTSLDRFFESLGLIYSEPEHVSLAETQLLNLHQGKRSAEEYCSVFRKWCVTAGWCDPALKALFRQGLSDAIKDVWVSHPNPSTLEQAMALAVRIDRRLRERKKERLGPDLPSVFSVSPSSFSKKSVSSPSTSVEEPVQNGAMNAKERREYRLKNALCLYCGRSGHFLRNCPTKPRSPSEELQCLSGSPKSHSCNQAIKCRAAVAYDFKKPLVVEEIEVAPPKAHEIRVKVCASGICHTDDHALGGGMASLNFPVILGHEGAGIVESVGKGVFKVQPGDHVILLCSPMCMKCKACLHEESNFCERNDVGKNLGLMLDKTTRFSIKGKMIHNFMSTSTFTEYTVVDEFAICRIDKAAPMDQVCLIGCGFSTGFGTVLNTAKVKPGSSCVVYGLGGIGMSAVMACKISGATKIIGVDINPTKFDKAKELGCTECVNPNDSCKPIHEVIIDMTKGGADYGFECIGKVDVMASMIQSTNYAYGSANIIGVPPFKDRMSLDVMWLLTGRTLQGAFLGDYKANLDFPKLVDEVMAGKIDLDPLVSHRLPFEKVNEGFDLMRNGKTIRTVLTMPK